MSTLTIKNARLELKTTKEVKELLNKAAILDGMDLSAFMLSTAIQKARDILRDHTAINLSENGQKKLADMLKTPTEPTPDMLELRKMTRTEVRE